MRHVGEGTGHCELSALSEDTLNINSPVMLQDNTLCNGKAKACSADFPRPGFVDPVEPLIDLVQGVLRNTHARVLNTDIEVVGIGVERHSDFSVIAIVLDRVLDQICDDHDHLNFVDLGINFPHADHCQLYISFLRDGSHSPEDQLDHLVDVAFLYVEFGILPIHAHQSKQLRLPRS